MGWADTRILILLKPVLYDPILQGMECDDAQSSLRVQQLDHGIDGVVQNIQLMIQLNTDSLKAAF